MELRFTKKVLPEVASNQQVQQQSWHLQTIKQQERPFATSPPPFSTSTPPWSPQAPLAEVQGELWRVQW